MNTTLFQKNLFAFFAAAAFFAVFGGAAYRVAAQEGLSVRIQPAIIEENVDPGQVLRETIRITNQDSAAKTFYLIVRDIKDVEAEGQPVFAEGGEAVLYGVSGWIRFDVPSVTIGGGEMKEVSFTVVVPESPTPGGHFGGVFFSLEPKRPENTGAGIGLQLGAILNLRVAGEVVEEARIREFSTDKSVYSKPVVTFTARVENLGNVLLNPRGPLEISDMFGNKAATMIVNDEFAGVFPKRERSFSAVWQSEGFKIGRYQATVAFSYGQDGSKTTYASLSFWVLPLGVILPVLFGIIGLILAVYFGMRAYIRKKVRELQNGMGGAGKGAPFEAKPFPSRFLFIALGFILFSIVFLLIIFLLFS